MPLANGGVRRMSDEVVCQTRITEARVAYSCRDSSVESPLLDGCSFLG